MASPRARGVLVASGLLLLASYALPAMHRAGGGDFSSRGWIGLTYVAALVAALVAAGLARKGGRFGRAPGILALGVVVAVLDPESRDAWDLRVRGRVAALWSAFFAAWAAGACLLRPSPAPAS